MVRNDFCFLRLCFTITSKLSHLWLSSAQEHQNVSDGNRSAPSVWHWNASQSHWLASPIRIQCEWRSGWLCAVKEQLKFNGIAAIWIGQNNAHSHLIAHISSNKEFISIKSPICAGIFNGPMSFTYACVCVDVHIICPYFNISSGCCCVRALPIRAMCVCLLCSLIAT